MNLLRLLSMGSGFQKMAGDQSGYRLLKVPALPKFGANPKFGARQTETVSKAPDLERAMAERVASPTVKAVAPSKQVLGKTELVKVARTVPASLSEIRVMRNELFDSDIEVVRCEAAKATPVEKPVQKPVERAQQVRTSASELPGMLWDRIFGAATGGQKAGARG